MGPDPHDGALSLPAQVLAEAPSHTRKGLQALSDKGYIPAKLANVTPRDILERYMSDESTKDIADSYGVTRQALGQFLLKHATDDWREAQIARAIARKEKADDDLEGAHDALSLARAREQLKSAQWDLERLLARLYGPKQEINANVNVQTSLVTVLSDIDARVIEGESTHIPHTNEEKA